MGGDNKQIVKRKIVRSSKVVRKITPPSGGSSTPIKDAGNSGMKDKKSRNIAEVKLFGESSHEEGGYLADVSLNVSNMHGLFLLVLIAYVYLFLSRERERECV